MSNAITKRKNKSRKYLVWLLLVPLALVLFALFPVTAQPAKHYTELEFPPAPEVKLPDYTRYQLDNGLVVYLMEDRELPLVSGRALFRTGDRFEPDSEVGLAQIVGEVMRTGGTKFHSPDELNQILEQKAASVETSIDTTSGSANFNTLSENLPQVFGLFAEVIRYPVFAEEKIELAKTQQAGAIARRNDNPSDVAMREFRKLIYGEKSPYARTVEYRTLENISRPDVVGFYQKYFAPNNTILGIVGDFDTEEMRSLIEAKFGDWKPDPKLDRPTSNLPPVTQAKKSGIFLVNQPQLTQSNIQLGHLGGELKNPDYPAISVLNGVLNGFGGRLFNQIRSRQGLAYSVYGVWSPRYDYPGMFIAGGSTRSDATVPFIAAMLEEIERIRTEPITEEELEYAKESALNSFIFNFADPSQTLSRLMRYEYYGYPEDFIFQYQRGVEETTIEDVQRVAQNYLAPEQLVTLVVGNSTAIEPPLTSLAPETNVTAIDITIPDPSS
ncbi:M16 family metallopeptidase [Phormidium sp. CCY1219]|uniref:M16 family metallopeptidase n=1 Tax=Phormidium sp. CCY1219 TaxID=2886104 RepID=UPI002D1E8B4F|nr:pitrilysin family protein [Phormidium sp. CCY1219]MEB3831681.1 insulinase family protein [Phormidium sp. CCY1219]